MQRPMPQCEINKSLQSSRATDVSRDLEFNGFSLAACRSGLESLISITGSAMQNQNADAMADFLDDGGCELVLKILHLHGELNEDIAANCCRVLSILAWSLPEMKEFLGEIGACEIVSYTAFTHIGSPLVSEHATAAIAYLSFENSVNGVRFADAGACDILIQMGNFGFNLRHDRCVNVAINVCYAIPAFCNETNASQLMESGACALVSELLKLHMKSNEFIAAGIKAISALAGVNNSLREELGKVEACEHIMDAIALYQASDIRLIVVEAIMRLSFFPMNTAMLGECGACEVLVESLSRLIESPKGLEYCIVSMKNLATNGFSEKQNRLRFLNAGALDELRVIRSKADINSSLSSVLNSVMEVLSSSSASSSSKNNNDPLTLPLPQRRSGESSDGKTTTTTTATTALQETREGDSEGQTTRDGHGTDYYDSRLRSQSSASAGSSSNDDNDEVASHDSFHRELDETHDM